MDIKQFDPTKNNLMSESIYGASSFLNQGANTGKASSSAFNRLMYQLSIMVKALADMMEGNGYPCDDASLSILTTQLDNIMTLNKMSTYATNATLAGYLAKASVLMKTTDYIVTANDFYKTIEMNYSGAGSKTISLPAYTSWGNGAFLKIKNIGTTAVIISATIDGVPNPTLAQNEEITVYNDGYALRGKVIKDVATLDFSKQSLTPPNGYQVFPGTPHQLIIQWGKYNGTLTESSSPYSVSLPISFPNGCFYSNAILNLSLYNAGADCWIQQLESNNTMGAKTTLAFGIQGGSTGPWGNVIGFSWFAIGY